MIYHTDYFLLGKLAAFSSQVSLTNADVRSIREFFICVNSGSPAPASPERGSVNNNTGGARARE